MLKKIFLFLLIFVLLGVLLALGWAGQLFFDFPSGSMWLWPVVPLVTWALFSIARRLFVRYRALKRLKTTLPQEKLFIPDEEWVSEVQNYLSNLKNHEGPRLGNHRLHFVLGVNGSGKTSLLQNSHSSSYFGRLNEEDELSSTRSCRLEFLESGIAVEISGNHVDPEGDALERDEAWKRLLAGMTADIVPQQCASVTVCISVSELTSKSISHTHQSLYLIRQRINDLMAMARCKLPVYVVLTQADRLPGLNSLIERLPPDLQGQAAGVLLPFHAVDAVSNIRLSISQLIRYIPWLALRAKSQGGQIEQQGLFGTKDIRDLEAPLENALMSLFGASSYREPPVFRGLFISAALGAVQRASINKQRPMAFGPALFDEVLAQDRVFQPLQSYEKKIKNRERLSWAAYYLAVGLVATWFVAGYLNASSELKVISQFKLAKVSETDSDETHVKSLVQIHPQVVWLVDQTTDDWNFLLPYSSVVEIFRERLKQNFIETYASFQNNVLDKKFWAMYESVGGRNAEFTALVLDYLVSRFALITASIEGQTLARLSKLPRPTANAVRYLAPEVSLLDADKLNNMFLLYTAWDTKDSLKARLDFFKSTLMDLTKRELSLSWLNVWASQQPGIPEVSLNDFWNPTAEPSEIKVHPAFTLAGYKAISEFMKRIDSVGVLREVYQHKQAAYWENYKIQRDLEWKNFILQFSEGRHLLKTEMDWVDLLTNLSSPMSPYSRIEELLLSEFPEVGSLPRPEWITSINVVRSIRMGAMNKSVIGAVTAKIDTAQASAPILLSQSKVGSPSKAIQNQKNLMNAMKVYSVFGEAIAKSQVQALTSQGSAASLAMDFSVIGRDPAVKDSSLRNAFNAMKRIEDILGSQTQPSNEAAWILLRGELVTTAAYAYLNAACSMQSAWESQVIASTQLATNETDVYNKVMGAEGTLWTYLDKTAKPFLIQNATGYSKAEVSKWMLPWDADFLAFINRAANEKRKMDAAEQKTALQEKLADTRSQATLKAIDDRIPKIDAEIAKFNQSKFNVNISSYPVRANAGATQPYGSSLTLSCAPGPQLLTQLNYSTNMVFNWAPSTCGDTELKIFIDNQTLTKRWSGEFGFIEFLKEFKDGKKSYVPSDFPDNKDALDELGVNRIDATFLIKQGVPLQTGLAQYEADVSERAKLLAEKESTLQNQAIRQEKAISGKINSLSVSPPVTVLPLKAVTCKL